MGLTKNQSYDLNETFFYKSYEINQKSIKIMGVIHISFEMPQGKLFISSF